MESYYYIRNNEYEILNMTNQVGNHYKESARLLRAISHPVRLAILEILNEVDEACVCHLEALLGYRQAYLSQHLMCLREHNLVSDRRFGMNIYYRINQKGVASIIQETRNCTLTKKLDFHAEDCVCPECEREKFLKNSEKKEVI